MKDKIRLDVELTKEEDRLLKARAKRERRTKRRMAQVLIAEGLHKA